MVLHFILLGTTGHILYRHVGGVVAVESNWHMDYPTFYFIMNFPLI